MGLGIDAARWAAAALCVVCVLATLTGMLLEGAGNAAERALLAGAARDRLAKQPSRDLLAHHMRWHPVRPAQLAAGLAGIGLTTGVAGLLLTTTHTRTFDGAADLFAGFERPSLLMIAGAVVVFVAAHVWNAVALHRGAALCNLLLARWPTPPVVPTASDAKVPAALTGPALTRRRRNRR